MQQTVRKNEKFGITKKYFVKLTLVIHEIFAKNVRDQISAISAISTLWCVSHNVEKWPIHSHRKKNFVKSTI